MSMSSTPPPPPPAAYRRRQREVKPPCSPPTAFSFQGRSFIPPMSSFARAVINSDNGADDNDQNKSQQTVSALTVLLDQHDREQANHSQPVPVQGVQESVAVNCNEADSASGPPVSLLGSSCPSHLLAVAPKLASSVITRPSSSGEVMESEPGKVRR
jgi:hypothetical protein